MSEVMEWMSDWVLSPVNRSRGFFLVSMRPNVYSAPFFTKRLGFQTVDMAPLTANDAQDLAKRRLASVQVPEVTKLSITEAMSNREYGSLTGVPLLCTMLVHMYVCACARCVYGYLACVCVCSGALWWFAGCSGSERCSAFENKFRRTSPTGKILLDRTVAAHHHVRNIHIYIHTYTYMHTYMVAYIHAHVGTIHIHTYIHTYTHTYKHACIHTYTHACIHE